MYTRARSKEGWMKMHCTICQTAACNTLYENLADRIHTTVNGTYTLCRCSQCNLIFVSPQPSAAKLSEHYPDDYHVYLRAPQHLSKKKSILASLVAKHYFGYGKSNALVKVLLTPIYFRANHLPHYVKNGRILDVGCGTGTRLPLFQFLGWEVEGIEPSKKASTIGQSAGYKIQNGFFDELTLPEGYCDAIYLNNVFEHIPDLHIFLEKAKIVLKNKGELILVVPNTKSLTFKLFKKHWYALEIPRHLYNFDEYNLNALLKSHHFSVKKIRYCNFLGSLTSSLALALNKKPDYFSKLDRLAQFIPLILDPIMNFSKLGDWLVIHATLEN